MYEINYDKNEDILYIMNIPNDSPTKTDIKNYGIEIDYDVNGFPLNIVIPEASVLTGIKKSELKRFSGNNLNF